MRRKICNLMMIFGLVIAGLSFFVENDYTGLLFENPAMTMRNFCRMDIFNAPYL